MPARAYDTTTIEQIFTCDKRGGATARDAYVDEHDGTDRQRVELVFELGAR